MWKQKFTFNVVASGFGRPDKIFLPGTIDYRLNEIRNNNQMPKPRYGVKGFGDIMTITPERLKAKAAESLRSHRENGKSYWLKRAASYRKQAMELENERT